MAGGKIKYERIEYNGKRYDMYHIKYNGKWYRVASYALHRIIEKSLEEDSFHPLANYISSLYDVYIPRGVKKLGEDEIIKSAIDGIEDNL